MHITYTYMYHIYVQDATRLLKELRLHDEAEEVNLHLAHHHVIFLGDLVSK